MIVISSMNIKGGAGKTLISLVLSQYLVKMDYKVCYLDIDETAQGRGFGKYRKNEYGLELPWTYKHITEKDQIVDFIDDCEENDTFEVMIIDTPGHINELNIDILSRADLTLIPIMDDKNTTALAQRTQGLIVRASKTLDRKINYAFVFNRIDVNPPNPEFHKTYNQVMKSSVPYMKRVIHNRRPFKNTPMGLLITEMSTEINGKALHNKVTVKKAHDNALEFVTEVIEMISKLG